jgi:hypothetical protein
MVLCNDSPKKLVCRLTVISPGFGGLMIGYSHRLNCGVDEVTQNGCVLEEETAEIRTGKAKRGERIQSHPEDDLGKEKCNGEIEYRTRDCHHETGKLTMWMASGAGYDGYAGMGGNCKPHDQAIVNFPRFESQIEKDYRAKKSMKMPIEYQKRDLSRV